MSPTTIHLRSETKPLERRSPLSPASAKALVEAGFLLRVERCRDRIYGDDEFEAIGAEMVPAGSWVDAPREHIILGLKELSEDDSPLPHTYIHFQHCFKNQEGWAASLSRFVRGGGMLYDLEFLTGEDGRRIAAFGYWAGYAGAAIALIAWAHQLLYPGIAQGRVPRFDSALALADHVKSIIEASIDTNGGQHPRIIIIGALGRCGKGALDFCLGVGIPREYILGWDMEETSRGGPFPEVVASDIFINCVYLGPTRIPPFVTFDSLRTPERRLRVICDVSCDPNSENNPIPVYSSYSSFDSPTVPISRKLDGPELRVVAIDHLPTLVAREASDEFSRLLLPSLLTLNRRESEGVWVRAEHTFAEKVRELPGGCSSF